MRKYQWNDAKLKGKAQLCNRLVLLCAGVVLAMYFMEASSWLMLAVFVCAIGLYVLSLRMQSKDAKLKPK